MSASKILLLATVAALLWAAVLISGVLDEPDMNEDWSTVLCIAGALYVGSKAVATK